MPSSWQVRLATLLVGLGVIPAVALLVLAARLSTADPGFLFAVLPVVITVMGCAGVFLGLAALTVALRLWTGAKGARLQTTALGVVLVVTGACTLPVQPAVGLLIALQGLGLVALMITAAAKRDLDGWLDGLTQPAPWGSTPGTGLWSDEPVQQGPWSPDPTTVPWFTRDPQAGPQPPWWQTWQLGLSRGIPLWEALLLGLAVLCWAIGLLLIFIGLGQRRIGVVPVVLIVPSVTVVSFLERRMRARLAGRG